MVHAARVYLGSLQPGQVVVKQNFRNTFNSIRRDTIFAAIEPLATEILPFMHSAYSSSSSLFFGKDVMQSAEGVQQGDPLGPLPFSLSIHNRMLQLKSEFQAFYLNEGILGGYVEEVLHDLQTVECGREYRFGVKPSEM